ncbi:MAG: hypothetical protein ACHQ7M_05090 [Chloroflexota bacterium]
MNFFVGVRAALAGGHQDAVVSLAAGEAEAPPPADLRCHNSECDLHLLRLEADEVAETPGSQPDRCASCGQQLRLYTDPKE